jgi:hypothetical protein
VVLRSTIVAIVGFWVRGVVDRGRENSLDMLAARCLLGLSWTSRSASLSYIRWKRGRVSFVPMRARFTPKYIYQSEARSHLLCSHVALRSKYDFERSNFVKNCQVSVGRDLMLQLLRTKGLAGNLLVFWRRMIAGKEEVSIVFYRPKIFNSANFRQLCPKCLFSC